MWGLRFPGGDGGWEVEGSRPGRGQSGRDGEDESLESGSTD